MEIEVQYFIDYVPASELIDIWGMHERDLIIRAMRNQVDFYYAVKSSKRLTYHPITSDKIQKEWLMGIKTFFSSVNRTYSSGDIIKIDGFDRLNSLGKKVLHELEVLSYCQDTHSVIFRHELLKNKFHPIRFEDILVEVNQATQLKEILASERATIEQEKADTENQVPSLKPMSKQSQREEIFLRWLAKKDKTLVSNMKKDEVWEELRKIDHRLFSVEPKNFFRDQKIVTFKPGRKPS
jgi:hypothetical protein